MYLSQKNDGAVCVQSSLALFEQQSSWNPNMHLRGLLYFAAEYAGWLARHKKDVHSGGLVKIPAPDYYVLYNGTAERQEREELRLSDAFEKPAEGYEWTAHVVNVNAGHNTAILDRCELLGEYADFIADTRQKQQKGLSPRAAIDAAVDACIQRDGKLAEFMRKHKAEVNGMYLFGVDFEKIHREAMKEEARKEREKIREEARKEREKIREEAREEAREIARIEKEKAREEARKEREKAREEGRDEERRNGLRNLLKNTGMSLSQAMDALGIQEAERGKYAAMLSS